MKNLAMLSMGAGIIPMLNGIAHEIDPSVNVIHFLHDGVLAQISQNDNKLSPGMLEQLLLLAFSAQKSGADGLLITCSSISEFADYARAFLSIPIFKIDEPMLLAALEQGENIGVVATIDTTLQPTLRQLRALAERQSKHPMIKQRLNASAYQAFVDGNFELHDVLVSQAVIELCAECDVVILAQASMARVTSHLPLPFQAKILSSPRLGISNAIACIR